MTSQKFGVFRAVCCVVTLVCLCSSVAGDPPQLDYLYPPGGQVGESVAVTAGGKFPDWPVSGWCASPGVAIRAEETSGKLTVSLAPEVTPGVHWIRLSSSRGASVLRPFIVESVPEIVEEALPADPLEFGAARIINGRLKKNNEVDSYAFRLQPGTQFVASVMAHRYLRSPMDVVLQLYDRKNQVVVDQADDAPGLDPQLIFTSPSGGDYSVRIFAFPETPTATIGFAGGENFIYRLALSTTGMIEYAIPLSVSRQGSNVARPQGWGLPADLNSVSSLGPGDHQLTCFAKGTPGWSQLPVVAMASTLEGTDSTADLPHELDVPSTVTGRLDREDRGDVYRWHARAGEKFRIVIAARSLGFPIDPVLAVHDDQGNEIAATDDAGPSRDGAVEFAPTTDGWYRVLVRDLYGQGSDRHWYRMTIGHVEPSYEIQLDTDLLVARVGIPFEIPVTIVRQNGFSRPIELVIPGLPDTIRAFASQSAGTGDSAQKTTIRIVADQPVQLALRILGTTLEADQHVWASAPRTADGQRTTDMWLSVLPAE